MVREGGRDRNQDENRPAPPWRARNHDLDEREREADREEPRLQVEQRRLVAGEVEARRFHRREEQWVVSVEQGGLREPGCIETVERGQRVLLRRPERPRVLGPHRLEPVVDREDCEHQRQNSRREHEPDVATRRGLARPPGTSRPSASSAQTTTSSQRTMPTPRTRSVWAITP